MYYRKAEAGRAFIHSNVSRTSDRRRLRVLNLHVEDTRAAALAQTDDARGSRREERPRRRSAGHRAALAAATADRKADRRSALSRRLRRGDVRRAVDVAGLRR